MSPAITRLALRMGCNIGIRTGMARRRKPTPGSEGTSTVAYCLPFIGDDFAHCARIHGWTEVRP